MVNHQDQSSLETGILGIGIMIEGQKTETDTGVTKHLRDLEVKGIEVMTDMFMGEKKDQKDTNMMQNMTTAIASGQGTTKIVNVRKKGGDKGDKRCWRL
jgi:hypothetical protein